MTDSTTVTVDGLTVATVPTVDPNGVEWTLVNLTGWYDSAPLRTAPLVRVGVPGAVDADPLDDARLIVVEGYLDAPTEAALMAAMRRASLLLTTPRRGPLVVTEGSTGLALSANVRREGQAVTSRQTHTGASFQWTLYAPDPNRYSSRPSSVALLPYTPGGGYTFPYVFPFLFGGLGSGGFVVARNGGVAPAVPVIRITGPCVNPVIRVVGGATVRVLVTLTAADTLVIDGRGPTVTVGGASVRHLVAASSSWPILPPGDSTVFFDTDTDTGSAVIEWLEVY